MKDHIRELLEEDGGPQEETVEYKGRTYLVRGEADANKLGNSLLLDDKEVQKKAVHFGSLIKKKIDPKVMRQLLIIHETLVAPEGANPYSMIELARLSTRQSGLIFKLSQAGTRVLGLDGLGESNEIEDDPVAKVALKNSEGAEGQGSPSSASAA